MLWGMRQFANVAQQLWSTNKTFEQIGHIMKNAWLTASVLSYNLNKGKVKLTHRLWLNCKKERTINSLMKMLTKTENRL